VIYELRILQQAVKDIEKSVDWYNEQKEGLGSRFLFQIIRAVKRPEANPLHYQERFQKKFRFVIVDDFPFVVVFKISKHFVVINSVFHTKRNPKKFH